MHPTGSSRYPDQVGAQVCRLLPIAPSSYHAHVACRRDPARASARARREAELRSEIARVHAENLDVYGAPKGLPRTPIRGLAAAAPRGGRGRPARTVERLMQAMGLRGAVRGKTVKTTIQDPAAPCPLDRVNRQFHAPAPNMLWVSDFTPAFAGAGSTWRPGRASPTQPLSSTPTRGASRDWRVSRTATAGFVTGALEQAIHQRRPEKGAGLVAHSDRGSQYLAIRYDLGVSPRPASPPPWARQADSYDNALAETVIGLFKTEVIRRRGPWRGLEAVEFATLEWVDRFNHRRLLEPIGNVPPAEAEAAFHAQMDVMNEAA